MKKLFLVVFVAMAAFPLTAQTNNQKILIAYFSLYENTVSNTNVDATSSASMVAQGNNRIGTTELIAQMIQNTVGGDTHSIVAVNPYPADFQAVIDQNHKEQAAGTLPRLKSKVANFAQYNVVFIGYPVWATTVPNVILSFLSEYNLSGKTIIPFCTHDGYGSGNSFTAIQRANPRAVMRDAFVVEAKQAAAARGEVETWIGRLNIASVAPSTNGETPITITIGNRKLTGVLNNSPEAKAFIAMLPQTISMVRYGDREYYGGMSNSISVQSKGKYNFIDGEITYCPANNTAAIFYAQTSRPNRGVFSRSANTENSCGVFFTHRNNSYNSRVYSRESGWRYF
jgi:flavodoxin